MKKLALIAVALGLVGLVAAYLLSAPSVLQASALPKHTPNLENGRTLYSAGGCASCHATPLKKGEKKSKLINLAGGLGLETPFGTFYVPNITPHKKDGIGGWSALDFVNAMMRGVTPKGAHYYPAFPYTSYASMKITDVLDLKAYLDTLPVIASKVRDHDLGLPFRIRRVLGLWKLLFFDTTLFKEDPKQSKLVNRGAYLVKGPGHCGECHTPRNLLGGKKLALSMSGGPAPDGDGSIPNITQHKSGLGEWTLDDIEVFLEEGALPDGDYVGGSMVDVQENMAQLKPEDRKAIAAYLKTLKPVGK